MSLSSVLIDTMEPSQPPYYLPSFVPTYALGVEAILPLDDKEYIVDQIKKPNHPSGSYVIYEHIFTPERIYIGKIRIAELAEQSGSCLINL